jgi:hypothetical protein
MLLCLMNENWLRAEMTVLSTRHFNEQRVLLLVGWFYDCFVEVGLWR